ncbi:hypothetical protein [Shewanella putrefaciens]|uniref:hypothetical protein n=1 Tax=Shewanella putrefaciens TaxID=24 RepID=UPI001C69223C|nr:hypothetical protein [Shewanella putrefaciens]
MLLPIFYTIIVAYSLIGTRFFSFAKEVPFDMFHKVNQVSSDIAATFFFVASISFFCGIKFLNFSSNPVVVNHNNPKFTFSKKIYDISDFFKFSFYLVTLLSLIFGYGFEYLLERQGYVSTEGRIHSLLIIYMLTLPITSFLLPFFKSNFVKIMLFIVLFAFIFGTTARMLILLPFFYFVADFIKCRKVSLIKVLFLISLLLFIVAFTLQFRNHAVQGVFPNLLYLMNYGLDFSFVILGINYILSYAFFATALGIQDFEFNQQAFLISINPLPSVFLDIDYMLKSLSLNTNSPLTAISVLSLGGYSLLVLFYFVTGYVFQKCNKFLFKKNRLLYMIAMVLFVMFTMFSVQYNLRGAVRLVYFIILLTFLAKLVNIFVFNYKRYFR